MHVYVGIGQDPLWMLGPAFMGQSEASSPAVSPAKKKAARAQDVYQGACCQQDLASSWETIPMVPKRRRASHGYLPRPVARHRPTPPPTPTPAAEPPATTPEGIFRALLAWLSS